MQISLQPLTQQAAQEILTWRYPDPWSVYNMHNDSATLTELLAGDYYAAQDATGQLVGFFCFGVPAQVPACKMAGAYLAPALDIGLGLRPDLTGRGLGARFVQTGLDFAISALGANAATPKACDPKAYALRLTVLTFNQRAIRVYQQCGFHVQAEYEAWGPNGSRAFLVMVRGLAAVVPS